VSCQAVVIEKLKQTAFKPKKTTYYAQDYVIVFMMSVFAQLFKKFKHFCYYSEILKIVFLKKFYTACLKNKDCTGRVEDSSSRNSVRPTDMTA